MSPYRSVADTQDRLGIHTAHVVGVAFGAVVAANLASAYADRVKTLTLISLPPNQDNEDTVMGYAECREVSIEGAESWTAALWLGLALSRPHPTRPSRAIPG